jgi:hypothetical protein
VAEGEALWLAEDAQAVLDYLREKALACPGCGLPRDETMDPEAVDHYRSRTLRCHACAAREREAERFTSGPHIRGGLLFTAERVNDH